MLAIDFDKVTAPQPATGKPTPAVVTSVSQGDLQGALSRLRLERIEMLNRAMQVDNVLYRSERKAFVNGLAALEKHRY